MGSGRKAGAGHGRLAGLVRHYGSYKGSTLPGGPSRIDVNCYEIQMGSGASPSRHIPLGALLKKPIDVTGHQLHRRDSNLARAPESRARDVRRGRNAINVDSLILKLLLHR